MSISIINGNKYLFDLELIINEKEIEINYKHDSINLSWDESCYKTDKVIQDLIEKDTISLFVLFDNSQSGYVKTVPFHLNKHQVNNAEVRGVLEISIVGVANTICSIQTIYPDTNYAFPKNSHVLNSSPSSNIRLPIGSENEKTAESYLKCKHVDNLQIPFRLDYDNEKFIMLNVKDEQIQKKWESVSKRHSFHEKSTKENIGFSSSIWSPILFKILLDVYEDHNTYGNGSKLWYKNLEKEGMINLTKTGEYDEIKESKSAAYDFILYQVDEYIYENTDSWTVELLFKTFCS